MVLALAALASCLSVISCTLTLLAWPTNKLGCRTRLTFDLPLTRSKATAPGWLLINTAAF